MRSILTALIFVTSIQLQAQPLLKVGDIFPNLLIRPIINAPVTSLDVHAPNKKFLILNFWGTWCSPCLPEMDSLAKLQAKNSSLIQVVAISGETVDRLRKYLQRKPSGLWLASDTTSNLYRQFGFNYVGQSAIIDQQHRIIGLVRTDSINQLLIDKLARKEAIRLTAETGQKRNMEEEDVFAVDSSLGFQVAWSSYRPAVPSMSKHYKKSVFEGRRLSYFNMSLPGIYQDIYDVSYKQVIYEVPEKSVSDWNNKSTLYCFDLMVKPEQKDSLAIIMKELLNKIFPVKARSGKKEMPVYVLRKLAASADWKESAVTESTYSFSGQGFDGKGISMKPFVDYVANELQLPVVDESGLKGKYDIVTENVLRTSEDMLAALKKLGLTVEKTTREMETLIIYQ